MSEKTTQANFRLPVELIEWMDQYATFLSDEGGFSVSRTQALLRIISLSRSKETARMIYYYYHNKEARESGFTDIEEYRDFKNGVTALFEKRKNEITESGEPLEIQRDEFYTSTIKNTIEREKAITVGKEIREKENKLSHQLIQLKMTLALLEEHAGGGSISAEKTRDDIKECQMSLEYLKMHRNLD